MNNFEAAIVKYVCPICGSVVEDNIIINSRLTEEDASKVRELHNKIVGYSDHACEECSKYKDDVVYFIEIDLEKSVGNDMYRTGRISGIRKESELVAAAEKYIITLEDGTRFCYIDKKEGKRIGMWND